MLFVCTKEGLIIPVLLSHQVYSSLQDRYAGNRRYICVKKLADSPYLQEESEKEIYIIQSPCSSI